MVALNDPICANLPNIIYAIISVDSFTGENDANS